MSKAVVYKDMFELSPAQAAAASELAENAKRGETFILCLEIAPSSQDQDSILYAFAGIVTPIGYEQDPNIPTGVNIQ